MPVLREVRRFFSSHVKRESTGVVAVSGGADSVALLRALHAIHRGQLVVTHVNHQLRGTESDSDEAFVRELAERLGMAYRMKSVDVGARAARGNLEATARHVRYEFFAEVAAEVRAEWIATAHSADDQAETVLHRLIRGAGLQGLRGIAHKQSTIIRPLLTITRSDVLEYLASLNQSYREDSSNSDLRFTRNRLRHELLPQLKTFNPDIVTALNQLASQASEAFEVLESDAERLIAEVELPRAGDRLILDLTQLAIVHRYLMQELFRLLWQREGWPRREMTAEHWSRLAAIATGTLVAADFPGGINARRVGRVMQIGR